VKLSTFILNKKIESVTISGVENNEMDYQASKVSALLMIRGRLGTNATAVSQIQYLIQRKTFPTIEETAMHIQ
jgi:hypothetical protein